MENIILNIWIDMKNGLKVRLLEKPAGKMMITKKFISAWV